MQSTVWDHAFGGAQRIHPAATSIGLRASLGGGRYLGREATSTASAAVTVPVDFALPFGKTSSLCASVLPGFGFGRVTSADLADSGVLPIVGAAIAWSDNSRFGMSLGVQRIIIEGGPTQIGAALSLKLGHGHDGRP